jgi:hypothetical protein
MALSNWDLLAIGKNGKSCDGIVKGKIASLEIYKNWAYVSSEKMYQDGGPYINPIIASVSSGDLQIGRLHINAIRHSLQNSIFVFVNASTYDNNSKEHSNYFAGIGCYGYYTKIKEFLKWKGIEFPYHDYMEGSRNYRTGINNETIPLEKSVDYISLHDKDGNLLYETEIDEEFGELTDFVGVMPETFEAFKKWLTIDVKDDNKYSKSFNKWLDSIKWDSLTRFNQGDAFFVGSKEAATNVGNQNEDTILMNILKP